MPDFQLQRLSPAAEAALDLDQTPAQVATGFRFVEGPLWDARARALLLSDIPSNRIHSWSSAQGTGIVREPSGKSNGLTWALDGALLACEHVGRRVSGCDADGTWRSVVDSYGGKRLNSPNDLVLRSDGSIYFSDPPYGIQSAEVGELAEQEQPLNGLYLLRPGQTEPVLVGSDFERPNGLAFSPDESILYVADTPRYQVRAFAVAADGSLSNSRVFAQFNEAQGVGRPDGMKVDQAGRLYTTGPGGLWVIAPDGELLAHRVFPERTANCAWGDADYCSLYVTATSSVYRLRVRTPGIPPVGMRSNQTRV